MRDPSILSLVSEFHTESLKGEAKQSFRTTKGNKKIQISQGFIPEIFFTLL